MKSSEAMWSSHMHGYERNFSNGVEKPEKMRASIPGGIL